MVRRSPAAPDDTRDLLRELAALLIALGAAMWVFRTGSSAGAFASFCILAVPAALLLRLTLKGFPSARSTRPWQAVVATVVAILSILALRQLANWLGEPGDAGNGINVFWTFGVGAALALYLAKKTGVRFLVFFACIVSAVGLAGFLDASLSGGIAESFGLFRGLMFLYALLLAGAGIAVWRKGAASVGRSVESEFEDAPATRSARRSTEVLTASAAIAVFACGYGITSALGLIPTIAGVDSAGSGAIWEILLLGVGLVAVIAGTQIAARGLTWAGGIGLVLFFYIVGLDIHSGERRPDSFGVWPAVLLVVGSVALVASLLPEASLGSVPKQIVERLRSGFKRS